MVAVIRKSSCDDLPFGKVNVPRKIFTKNRVQLAINIDVVLFRAVWLKTN